MMNQLTLAEPVKAVEHTESYSVVLEDADGVRHYWLPNGDYDGYDRDCNTKSCPSVATLE